MNAFVGALSSRTLVHTVVERAKVGFIHVALEIFCVERWGATDGVESDPALVTAIGGSQKHGTWNSRCVLLLSAAMSDRVVGNGEFCALGSFEDLQLFCFKAGCISVCL